jgi:hypothetical protein
MRDKILMSVLAFLLIGILSLQFVSSTLSEDEVVFYIAGCQIALGGGNYDYIAFGACSSLTGHHYCVNSTTYYDTLYQHCEGKDGVALTLDDCCPRSYYCPTGGPVPNGACSLRPAECTTYGTELECTQYGCLWLGGTCVDPANLTSCSDYTSQSSCDQDLLGLGTAGSRGIGTDICGKTIGNFVINASSCKCLWDTSQTVCRLYYESALVNYTGGFVNCTKNFTSLSNCNSGSEQVLKWSANCEGPGANCANSEVSGSSGFCVSGQKVVKCPKSLAQVGFFDWFTLLAVVLLLALYYYLKACRKKSAKKIVKSEKAKKKKSKKKR